MKRFLAIFLVLTFISPIFADEGMWTFDNPPLKQWKERYNFEPTQDWMDNVRLASPKVNGSSAGFVSANGLIITNHHVAAGYIERLSTKERNLMKTGFTAANQAAELKVPNGEASVLASFENVTDRIRGVENGAKDDAGAANNRINEIAKIEKECNDATKLRCNVTSFYSGGEYWLYRHKVYSDVRLVQAPEEQAAFFGGDYD
ncbi:MAG TPA: S46 family peptidase, partial [Pyrinomonadaceae bacterium]|nr:S46 family peptidase [Pyrinomonadaceae bacterium]